MMDCKCCVAEMQLPPLIWAWRARKVTVGKMIISAALLWRFDCWGRQHAYEFLIKCGGRLQKLAKVGVTVACLNMQKLGVKYISHESELVMNLRKESNLGYILHIFRLFCILAKFAFKKSEIQINLACSNSFRSLVSAQRIDKTLTFKFSFLSSECCKELSINIHPLSLHTIYIFFCDCCYHPCSSCYFFK